MGTHGYVSFKYKGIYYNFYSRSDSYLEHLGNLVVNEINTMINKNKVKEYKSRLLRIPLIEEEKDGDSGFYSFEDAIYSYDCFCYHTSEYEPCNEYVYVVDFDEGKLKMITSNNNVYNFNLYDIPLDWYEITQKNTHFEDEEPEDDFEEYSSDESNDENEAVLNKIKHLESKIEKLKLKLN